MPKNKGFYVIGKKGGRKPKGSGAKGFSVMKSPKKKKQK